MLFVSFTPDRDWFVFNEAGETVQRGFRNRKQAERHAYLAMYPGAANTRG